MATVLSIQIVGDSSSAEAALSRTAAAAGHTTGAFNSLTSQIAAMATGFGIGTLAADAVRKLYEMGTSAFEAKTRLFDLSTQTGVSVETLGSLSKVALYSGTSIDDVARASNRLSKALFEQNADSAGAAQAIKALGLNFGEFKALGADEQMLAVAKAMDGFADGTGKSAVAMELYGKQGAALLPFMKELAERGLMVTTQTTESARMAKELADDWVTLTGAGDGLSQQIANALLPTLSEFAKKAVETKDGISGITVVTEALKIVLQTFIVVGSNVAFVFGTIGREIGAIAARMAALARGDFAGFRAISEAVAEDGRKARAELDAFDARILGTAVRVDESLKDTRARAKPGLAGGGGEPAGRISESQRYLESLAKENEKLLESHITMTSGLEVLEKYRAAKLGVSAAAAKLIESNEKLRSSDAAVAAEREAAKKTDEEYAKAQAARLTSALKETETLTEQVARQREHNAQIGATASQLAVLEQAKMDDAIATAEQRYQEALASSARLEILMQLDEQVKRLKELKQLKAEGAVGQASADAAKEAAEAWRKTADSIYQGLTDSLFRAFESGTNFFKAFWDGIVNTFKVTVLKLGIKYVLDASGIAGMLGSASGSTGGVGSLLSMFSSLGSGVTGSLANSISSLGGLFGSTAAADFAAGMKGATLAAGVAGPTTAGSSGAMGAGAVAGGTAGTVAGWVAVGMMANEFAWKQGFRGSSIKESWNNPLAFTGMVQVGIDKFLQGLGMSSHAASLLSGSSLSAYIFGSGERKLEEGGITGTIKGGSVDAQAYANWSSKNGLWTRLFGGGSKETGTDTSALAADQASALNEAAKSIYTETQAWAKALKLPADELSKVSYALKVTLGNDAAANEKAIGAAFTAYQEKLAAQYTNLLKPFQKAGETLAGVFSRLATLQTFSETLNTLGGVFSRLARASVDARENLISLVGGMDVLAAQSQSYVQNYYTGDEVAGLKAKEISAALAAVGITKDISSRQDFRALVESTDISTETGQKQLATLLAVADSFAGLTDYLASTGGSLDSTAAQAPAIDALGSMFESGTAAQVNAINGVATGVWAAVAKLAEIVNGMTGAAPGAVSAPSSQVVPVGGWEVTTPVPQYSPSFLYFYTDR